MSVMRFRAVATLALFILLASCKKGGQARLQGHWKGIKAVGVSDTVLSSANLYAAQMELDFKDDKVKVVSGSDTQSGRFKIVREDKTSVVLTTDGDGPTDEQTFTFDDEKTMRWSVMPGKTIQFQKQ
jgi:hypothetical protein